MGLKVRLQCAICALAMVVGSVVAGAQTTASATVNPAIKPVTKPGKGCKVLTGAMVGFGEQTTRGDALEKLDQEVAAFLTKPRNALAKETERTVECKVYIKWLNEFECTAQATLCSKP